MRSLPYFCTILLMSSFHVGVAQDMPNPPYNSLNNSTDSLPVPPFAEKRPHISTHHGVERNDDYAWLRDPAWKGPEDGVKDSAIMNYILAENGYHDAVMTPLQSERDRLFNQIKGYVAEVDESVPVKDGAYYYWSCQTKNQNYPVRYRKKGIDGQAEIYFDANKESEGHSFYQAGGLNISPNGELLIYKVDTSGNEFFTLRIRNLLTGEELTDTIESIASTVWLPDGTGFYYSEFTPEWRTKKIFLHKLGTAKSEDILIAEETDDVRSIGLGQSFDERYIFIESGSKDENSISYIDLQDPTRAVRSLFGLTENRRYEVEHHNGYFYVLTNDQGDNMRLGRLPVGGNPDALEELIAHDPQTYITGFLPYKEQFVLSFKRLGLETFSVMDPVTFKMRAIEFMDPAYEAGLIPTYFEDDGLRYSYSSMACPNSTVEVKFADLKSTILKTQEIGSGFDPDLYTVERLWIDARDGVKVPISLAYRKDKYQKGTDSPLMLYGYGSYGYAIPAYFSSQALLWMDNGFAYAIAHPRGGDDLGYQWYLDGKYLKKESTFNDFADCAKALVSQGYVQHGNIATMGGSAGGMLMGTMANRYSDLFKVVIAAVPFVDVMNTMLDETLPLTPGEFKEWGNPIESEEYFRYMLGYSPYDNMRAQNYPAMYVTGGLTDPRVTYWEPAKWMAKLRELNTGRLPSIMHMNITAGHAGASRRDDALRERADFLAFTMHVFNLGE